LTLQKASHNFTKIVFIPLHTNLFNIVLLSFFLTIGLNNIYCQDISKKTIPAAIQKGTNNSASTTNFKNKVGQDLKKENDTIKKTDTIKYKKAFLEGTVKYTAKQYVRIDQKKKLITLYDNAELYYQDIELKSGKIILDYEKNEIYAGRIKDSTGKLTQNPKFKQGANLVEPDSIRFNFKTQKAIIWNSRTDQGEFKVKAAITKKENDSVYFLKGARFTTSTNANIIFKPLELN